MTEKDDTSLDKHQDTGHSGEDVKITRLTGMYEDYFIDYASYVILERAVPHITDGLKPVQRRIMHAMNRIDDGRFNKVANIIGKQSAHRNATRATRPRSAGEMPPSRGGVSTCEPNDNPRNASNPMLSGFCRFDDAPGLSTIDTRDPGWFFPKDNYKPSRLIREQILNIALRLTPIVEPDLTAAAVDV